MDLSRLNPNFKTKFREFIVKYAKHSLCRYSTRFVFLLICSLLISPFLVAQELQENDPNSDYGLVYFIRGKGVTSSPALVFNETDLFLTAFSITYNVFIDYSRVCKLNQNRYSVHKVSPGEHSFMVQGRGKKARRSKDALIIDIQEGKTYYIMVIHISAAVPAIQEVTRNTALDVFLEDNLELDPKCGDSDYVF